MHVHMPERSVGQERAREAAHDWIRWHPLLERTYMTEGVHVRSRHVIPLLIPSPSLGFVSPRNAPRHAIPSALHYMQLDPLRLRYRTGRSAWVP